MQNGKKEKGLNGSMPNEKEEEVREPYWEFMARELREFWKIEDDEETDKDPRQLELDL